MDIDADELDNLGPNSAVYSMMCASICEKVNGRLDEKLAKRQALYISVVSILLAIISLVGGYFINEALRYEVGKQVELRVEDEIRKSAGLIEFLPRVSSLNDIVASIDRSTSFSNEDANSAIEEFGALYSSFADIENPKLLVSATEARANRERLTNAFELLVRNFASANRNDLVLEISDLGPEISRNSGVVVQHLVQNLGRDLVGAAGGALTWSGEGQANFQTFSSYRVYVSRARETNFPELYLVFEPILWSLEGRGVSEISQLVSDIDDLSEVDRRGYEGIMTSLMQGTFSTSEGARKDRITARVREFAENYQGSSETLGQILANAG